MTKFMTLCFVLISAISYANDGVYYASGNHLIPIFETDISVQKEILTVKKINHDFIEVTVYYEFFNPKAAKEVIVGFEAFSPAGDVDPTPKNGQHPFMKNFTVKLNDKILGYDIAYVDDQEYAKTGKVNSLDLKTLVSNEIDIQDFYYVYHFKANFQPGVNKIIHTYTYKLSSSVEEYYNFDYVLTAANRWANKQIDDFTLILDMGECEEFRLGKTFYRENSEWLINGLGKMTNHTKNDYDYADYEETECVIQSGNLIFEKKNFHPEGELYVSSRRIYPTTDEPSMFNTPLSYSYFTYNYWEMEPTTELEKKILRNLPYARRGYVFKNADLQNYFSKQSWYMANLNYSSDTEGLHPLELEGVERYK